MAGLLIRLRMTLWRHGMRQTPGRMVGFVIGCGLALGAWGILIPSFALLRLQPLQLQSLTVTVFAGLTLMWAIFSIIAFGIDETLDPARFQVLPVRGRELVPGLFAAAFLGIPAIFTSGLALAQVGAWSTSLPTTFAALIAAVVGVATSVLLSRVTATALARVMSTRRGRELGALVISLVTVLPLLANLALTDGKPLDLDTVDARPYADVVGWTPVGWAWSLPYDVATGQWWHAAVHLALALALVVGLGAAWVRLLDLAMVTPAYTGGGQKVGTGRLLPALLGTSPAATIATRRVRAWRRDSRLVSIATRAILLPIVLLLQGALTKGELQSAGFGVVSIAVFSGLTLMNDLAFDGPAWWLHVASGAGGVADRAGRVIATLLVFGPVTAVTYVAAVALDLVRDPVWWAAVVVTALLASLAVATAYGSVVPGTAPRTGGNPFAARSGAATAGCVSSLVAFVGPLLLVAPVVVAGKLFDLSPWTLLVAGSIWGSALLVAAVVLGGRYLDDSAPEMLQKLKGAQV